MGDTIRDPFDDSDDEDIDQPRTPDIQHGGDDGSPGTPDGPGFSDISDNEDKDPDEGVVAEDSGGNEGSSKANSPDREDEDDSKEILNNEHENKQESSNSTPASDLNASPASLESEEAAETIEALNVSKEDKLASDRVQEERETLESQETKQDSTPDTSPVEVQGNENDDHSDNKTSTEQPTGKEGRDKSGENELDEDAGISRRRRESSGAFTDDDAEMPISPLGLGLSGPESEIVEDILKSDVSKLLPNVSEEADLNTPVCLEGDNNDEDESVHLDSEEEAIPKTDTAEQNEEGSDSGEAGDQLIADIFGASDEEEEFEGFGQEDIEVTRKKKGARDKRNRSLSGDEGEEKAADVEEPMTVPKPKPGKTYDSDNDDDKEFNDKPVFVSDFDLMIQKKKEINRSFRRKRKNFDIINDSDDLIAGMIKQMKEVAEEDRLLNGAKQAATKKLKMFPSVLKHLNKADLQMTFLDLGVLPVLKDWLSPLPDGSLPHLQIREGLLKVLSEFPPMDTGSLKMSGLGKAVMYLYRHPKETRQNKEIAGKLINDWARPIFGVTSNFKSLSREEREERDYQNMSKRRRLSSRDSDGGRTPKSIDSALQSEKKPVRPGDKGFIMRARVPMPSNKDYVVRPQNTIDRIDFSRKPQKSMNRFEKQKRKFDEKKKLLNRGSQRAVDISIEGRKMAL